MTFEAFQSYIKENVLKEWREDADGCGEEE